MSPIVIIIFIVILTIVIVQVADWLRWSKHMKKNNQRLDLLSKENARLYEENFHLKDKLKNLGFTEEKLK